VIPCDRREPTIRLRLAEDDAYFNDLSTRWGKLLDEGRTAIPDPPFMKSGL
jgi:predicted proteasome-type protease